MRVGWSLVWFLLGGCAPGPDATHDTDRGTSGSQTETWWTATSSDEVTGGSSVGSDTMLDEGSTTGIGGFIEPTTGPTLPPVPCDPWRSDHFCVESSKCAPFSADGSGYWNDTRCVPIDPDPDPVGAPCSVEGSPTSGYDSCEIDAMCWNVDADTLEGECVAYCMGNEADPICPDGHGCGIFNGGVLILCLPTCDPLGDDCDDGFACRPAGKEFLCRPMQTGVHDGCREQCPEDRFCTGLDGRDLCDEDCCAAYCDLGDPDADEGCSALDDELVCVPFLGAPVPDGYEHVGACLPAR